MPGGPQGHEQHELDLGVWQLHSAAQCCTVLHSAAQYELTDPVAACSGNVWWARLL